ncbi:putative enoyl-CoA hydratase [Nocardia nova SH22a]|uniref:Putative enoyl-CoA hydratase n=1 Tax=Nocardia nova SH22a TaxID=1415166 RepID=W5TL30_9NOCA|nr:enoyl-CoA hydratase/isomerase family protein [Nocardia nova]AHH19849.1 putative enoyl-CoA hydratase [Nocardia nova SH22a]
MTVRCRIDDAVARITLADPRRGNPLTHESTAALLEALHQARAARVRVVVLDAEGWAFCVGGDLSAFAASAAPAAYVAELADLLHRVVLELHDMDAIVVSVVHGAAAGAGFPLALAADLVLATPEARFTLGYTKVGLTPDGGATLLARTIGVHRALALALSNDTIDSADALKLGLVTHVSADPAAAIRTIAGDLVAGAPEAQRTVKRLMRAAVPTDIAAVLDREAAAVTAAAATAESAEGIAAFLARRAPQFPPPTRP